MNAGAAPVPLFDKLSIRSVTGTDLPAIVKLDETVTGQAKPDYWRKLLASVEQDSKQELIVLVAEANGRIIGYIAGNVRAFEFGSEPCGWVFDLNVDPSVRDKNAGTCLFEELCGRFKKAGVAKVRTMLSRNNELVLAFFRSLGMMTGPFLQLEKDLD